MRTHQSLTERVYRYLKARPHRWVDGRALARVGGYSAFRTRISNARKRFGADIENRWYDKRIGKQAVRVSEYRYIGEVPRG